MATVQVNSRCSKCRIPPAADMLLAVVRRKPVIGIVGGIGSGKSLVASEFERQGCLLISADKLNDDILRNQTVVATLRSWWGDGVVAADGSADRGKIAEIVFADPRERQRLESLTHPLIASRRAAIIKAGVDEPAVVAIILDSPLLFESRLDNQCDRIVFVEAGKANRLDRVRRTRGWDESELDRRELAQFPLGQKKARSHYVIPNDDSPDQIRARVTDVLTRILGEVSPDRPK